MMKKLKISPWMLTIIFIILVCLLSLNLYSNYIAQKNAVIELIHHSSIQLSKAIEKASKNTIISYRLFILHLQERMISDLSYIRFLDSRGEITYKILSDYANEKKMIDIYLLDKDGNLEFFTEKEKSPFLPYDDIQKLISGSKKRINFGLLKAHGNNEKRLTVGIHRNNGGAIIGCRKGSHILSVRRVLDLNLLLKSITSDTTIKYIAIEDSSQILYATTEDSLSSIFDDDLMSQTYYEKSFNWRISDFKGKKIIETLHYSDERPIQSAIIRIALDYEPIQKIQHDMLNQALLRLLLIIVLGFLMIAYSIMLQNNQILETEKKKITEDVTALQANLVQKEKLSAIGELAAGVAHKIRNPLNAISMTIQRYDSEFEVNEDGDEFHELNGIIKKEINQISEIINQFLQFSRPTAICKSNTDLNELILKVVELYTVTLRQRNIELIYSDDDKIIAYLDDDKIKQSIINLLENAIDASEDGGKITIHLKRIKHKIHITISDTGSGIDDEDLSKIYNLYYTTKENGTGIGLAQVYRIISEHDGKILVDSYTDVGTTFTLILPMEEEVS